MKPRSFPWRTLAGAYVLLVRVIGGVVLGFSVCLLVWYVCNMAGALLMAMGGAIAGAVVIIGLGRLYYRCREMITVDGGRYWRVMLHKPAGIVGYTTREGAWRGLPEPPGFYEIRIAIDSSSLAPSDVMRLDAGVTIVETVVEGREASPMGCAIPSPYLPPGKESFYNSRSL